MTARRARALWLALCAAAAFTCAAAAQRWAAWGPVWAVAAFAAGALTCVCLGAAGAAVGILARPGAHHRPRAPGNLAARHEYVIPPPPEHSSSWTGRPWPPTGWREWKPGPEGKVKRS